MLTIHNLEVTFDVEGEGDEAVFVKLFNKHIQLWRRREEERKKQERQAESERSLGDHPWREAY
jgi:hypothetical protein